MTSPRRADTERYDEPAKRAPDEKPKPVRIRLLGGFSVSVGDRRVEEDRWRLRKAAILVKLLALAPGHRLHREQVMDLLWPDSGSKAAANNLHHVVHVARRTLEPDLSAASTYLRLRDERLALCPDGPLWVDVEAFEEASAAARRAREPAAYRVALDLYAGELLPEDRYEVWTENRREELRGLYLGLLAEMATLHEERGEYEPAILALGKVAADEPTREEAHTGLMRLNALSGKRGEAMRQYDRLSKALREFGAKPSAESRRLYEEISAGRVPSARSSSTGSALEEPVVSKDVPLHNLPISRTSFVGRERELLEVKRDLAMTRLLTLTGPGGSGKTRLALETARDLLGTYPNGVWLAELAPLSEEDLVAQEVAGALGVREQPGRSLADTLAGELRRKNLLLVLDNCEHLIEACARLADALLASCPGLRILATSREPLGVAGEVSRPVPPLSLPDPERPPTAGELEGYESARLFVERALYRPSAFVLTEENAKAVADICRQLDGIPLAIELAAARVGALAVEQISERLSESLKLLTGGGRMATPRQRTLRGSLDWSYELLDGPEKKLFDRLSVFAGGWTLEAAEAVGAGDGIEEGEVLDLVSRLVDRSLVVAESGAEGALRYRMLEPVRQYAREKLEEGSEAEAARNRHAAFFLALAEEAESRLTESRQIIWLERLDVEHDNLRAALSSLIGAGDADMALRLSGTLGEFWHMRGHLAEGRRWLEAALTKETGPESARAKALSKAAYIGWEQGEYGRSIALSEEALALSRERGDRPGVAAALYSMGMAMIHRQQHEEASPILEEAVALQRELKDETGLARTLQCLGLTTMVQGDFGRAEALYEEGLVLSRKTGDMLGTELLLLGQAFAALGQDEYGRAREICAEASGLSLRMDYKHSTAANLHILASVAGSEGQAVRAARLWGAAEALREAIDAHLAPVERTFFGRHVAAARSLLDEETWLAAWAEGRTMTPEEAVEYGLPAAEPATPASLRTSPREETADHLAASARIKALAWASWMAWEQGGDLQRAATLGEEGLALARKLGDRAGVAAALLNLGVTALRQNELDRAQELLEEAATLQRELENATGLVRSLQALGLVAVVRRDLERAQALFEESLALAERAEDQMGIVLTLGLGALVALGRDERERAMELLARGLGLSQRLGSRHGVVFLLHVSAVAAGAQGHAARSARLWGAAEALGETIGVGLVPVERHYYGPNMEASRERLGEEAWEAAWAEGRTMTEKQAVEQALSEEEVPYMAQGGVPRSEAADRDVASARAKALAWASWMWGDSELATTFGGEGLALARELGDEAGVAAALLNLGMVALRQNELERAWELLEEAATLQRELGDTAGLARSLQALGLVAVARHEYGRATALYEESRALIRGTEDTMAAVLLRRLGALAALGQGHHKRAWRLCEEGLVLSRDLGLRHGMVFLLHVAAVVAGARGKPARSTRLWGAAEALGEAVGVSLVAVERYHYGPYVDAARERLGEEAWAAARAEGRAMAPEQVVEYALSGEDHPPAAPRKSSPDGRPEALTRREREVAALIARELTNRQIAAELTISERTVDNHVANILRKLGLRSRGQVATRVTGPPHTTDSN